MMIKALLLVGILGGCCSNNTTNDHINTDCLVPEAFAGEEVLQYALCVVRGDTISKEITFLYRKNAQAYKLDGRATEQLINQTFDIVHFAHHLASPAYIQKELIERLRELETLK